MTSFQKRSEWVAAETGLGLKAPTRFSGPIGADDQTVIERIVRRFPFGRHVAWVDFLFLAGCVLWSLWPVLAAMADRWSTDPRYAHGYLVPIFSVALLWMRQSRLDGVKRSKSAWGLAFVGLGAIAQVVGGYFRIGTLEGLALLPYMSGLALLLGGWRVLSWAWPSIAFLAFMIPLPCRVENALGPPLQSMATTASTYLLQTLGFMAFAEGNVIQLNEARIGVVEACSGLSMLITFVALSTAAALVVKRPLWTGSSWSQARFLWPCWPTSPESP